MRRYEIEYEDLDEMTHKLTNKTLSIEDTREVLLQTIKQMKKEGIKIIRVFRVNKKKLIYTSIKY